MVVYSEEDIIEMEQKAQANNTSPNDEYAGQMREERVRTLLTEIDPENLLESIEYRIKGYRYDKYDNKWKKRHDSKDLPDELINKVVSLLSSVLNVNTTFTNLQTLDINKIMGLLIDTVISDLVVNGEKYQIHNDFNEKERICFIIFGTVYLTLRRAINGTEAKRFFGSLRMNESITPQRQRNGMADRFMDAVSMYR